MKNLTTGEVAELRGCSERYIRKLIQSGEIRVDEVKNVSGGGNSGISYLIPFAALDKRLQKKYLRLHPQKQEAEPEDKQEQKSSIIPFCLEALSEEERQQIVFWKGILNEWQQYRSGAKSKAEADEEYIQMLGIRYSGMSITPRSLVRKWKQWQDEGDIALVDRRGKHGNHHKKLEDYVYDIFESFYLDESRKTVTECMKLTELQLKQFAPQYLPIPSFDTFDRAVRSNRTPVPVVQYFRYGQKAYKDKCSAYIKRTYTDLNSNDIWVCDNHTFDVIVNENGKNVRMYLSTFLDVRSRKIVGWYVTDNPRSQATVIALRNGIRAYGIPKMVYSDNGREFLTHDIGGKGFRERKSYTESDEHKPPTILELLGIEFRTALVRNAKAKIVERAYRTLKEQFSRLFHGYTGGHVLERPERLKHLEKDPDNFTITEDFREYVDQWIRGCYNREAHTGDGMNGKCPDQIFSDCLIEQRVALPEELNLMMLRNSKMQKVKRNGVVLKFYDKELWFRTDELCLHHFGESVYLRYDPEDLNSVRVYNEEDRFIGEAALETPLSYFASTEEIQEHMQETRKLEKTVRAYKKQKGIETEDALVLKLNQAAESLEEEYALNPKVVELRRFVDNVLAEQEAEDLVLASGSDTVIDWSKANERLEKIKEE